MKIYDTRLRTKVDFEPLVSGQVRMYVCGPTVYNYIHIGNARTFVSFDMIRRYLLWRGFEVNFVQNVTDVDDKIIARAHDEGRSAAEVARDYTAAFIEDMHALNIMDPTVRPRATEEIDEMIALIETLIEGGHAYVTSEGDVYFRVRSFDGYGALSGRKVDEMEAGHRDLRSSGIEERKDDPLDFALWKAAKEGEPSWASPWGQGRPGWHIECSCMAQKYLGVPFDIHGGGADLLFPHHENERAQSEAATGMTFANHWMHGGMLQVDKEKMSKSLGNFLLLREILKVVSPNVLRFLMLQTHYRSPLDYSAERLEEAATALERLANTIKNLRWAAEHTEASASAGAGAGVAAQQAVLDASQVERLIGEARAAFTEAMDDDFNSPKALGALFDFSSAANALVAGKVLTPADTGLAHALADELEELLDVFGLDVNVLAQATSAANNVSDYPPEVVDLAHELAGFEGTDAAAAIEALLEARSAARSQKDWSRADALRDGLAALGFVVKDTPQGAQLEFVGEK